MSPSAEIVILPGGRVGAGTTRPLTLTYEEVCLAVAELTTLPEVEDYRNKAAAIQDWHRRAGNRAMEIDAAQARLLAERRAGQLLIEMRESGELADRGRPKKCQDDGHFTKVTLDDLGIDRNFSADAQKLARQDDFHDRLAVWREDMARGTGTITTRSMFGRPKGERKANDAYYSPHSMLYEAAARWQPSRGRISEPCCGDGRFADVLEAAGRTVIRGDIDTGEDFFRLTKAPARRLATNPPFKVFDANKQEIAGQNIRGFIDHAFRIGVTEMCLIIPERLFACQAGRAQLERHRPAIKADMDWREDYLGRGGSADRMLAVAIWTSPCAERCDYQVWSRENQP